jgi:hypothetical protein
MIAMQCAGTGSEYEGDGGVSPGKVSAGLRQCGWLLYW